MPARFAALDLGASSGRVMVAEVGPGELRLSEVRRFPHEPVLVPGPPDGAPSLHWDLLHLWAESVAGLREAGRRFEGIASVGVDTWAVDYGLLDATGRLLGNPYCYRDARTSGAVIERVHAQLSPERLYELNGLQHLPFTTLYQLAAAQDSPVLRAALSTSPASTDSAAFKDSGAGSLLLLPDLLGFWLGAEPGTEVTNASTTGLLSVRAPVWDDELLAAAGVSAGLLAPLRHPGEVIGTLRPELAATTGLGTGTRITAVGSHDTASAVVGVPAADERFAYIACGTWGLVGVELEQPVLSEASRKANFTNERGVDGRIRYLRNVMGLWLLQESMRSWQRAGGAPDLAALLARAAQLPDGGPVIDVDDPVFLPPGDMPARIAAACRKLGRPEPSSDAAVVRCVLDSLAAAFARTVHEAVDLSGHEVDVVHLVGGGALNELLCRLTARATGLPVLAGPVEATALGNVLVQARAGGGLSGDLGELRALVARTHELRRYEPGEPVG